MELCLDQISLETDMRRSSSCLRVRIPAWVRPHRYTLVEPPLDQTHRLNCTLLEYAYKGKVIIGWMFKIYNFLEEGQRLHQLQYSQQTQHHIFWKKTKTWCACRWIKFWCKWWHALDKQGAGHYLQAVNLPTSSDGSYAKYPSTQNLNPPLFCHVQVSFGI